MRPISQKPRRNRKSAEPLWMQRYPNITRGQAINLFCRECMGYTNHRERGISETWQMAGNAIRECTDSGCPLFRFRPGARRSGESINDGRTRSRNGRFIK